jgi:hypothetical protein
MLATVQRVVVSTGLADRSEQCTLIVTTSYKWMRRCIRLQEQQWFKKNVFSSREWNQNNMSNTKHDKSSSLFLKKLFRDCCKDFVHSLWLEILEDTLDWTCEDVKRGSSTDSGTATGTCVIKLPQSYLTDCHTKVPSLNLCISVLYSKH